jgi:hypothetical protein
MEINFYWQKLEEGSLETRPNVGELADVVSTVHYRRAATNGTYIVEMCGAIGYAAPSEDNFIPHSELTQEIIETWLNSSVDVEAIDAELNTKLENLKNPSVVILPLPWETNNI